MIIGILLSALEIPLKVLFSPLLILPVFPLSATRLPHVLSTSLEVTRRNLLSIPLTSVPRLEVAPERDRWVSLVALRKVPTPLSVVLVPVRVALRVRWVDLPLRLALDRRVLTHDPRVVTSVAQALVHIVRVLPRLERVPRQVAILVFSPPKSIPLELFKVSLTRRMVEISVLRSVRLVPWNLLASTHPSVLVNIGPTTLENTLLNLLKIAF